MTSAASIRHAGPPKVLGKSVAVRLSIRLLTVLIGIVSLGGGGSG